MGGSNFEDMTNGRTTRRRQAHPKAGSTELLDSTQGREAEVDELCSESERTIRDAALGESQAQDGHPARYFVRITRVSRRLLDEDNLCGKYGCDFLRYCGALPNDAPEQTSIHNTQRKVRSGEEEHTIIELFQINDKPKTD